MKTLNITSNNIFAILFSKLSSKLSAQEFCTFLNKQYALFIAKKKIFLNYSKLYQVSLYSDYNKVKCHLKCHS